MTALYFITLACIWVLSWKLSNKQTVGGGKKALKRRVIDFFPPSCIFTQTPSQKTVNKNWFMKP